MCSSASSSTPSLVVLSITPELRDKKKNIEESNANECFVCSLKQDRFGKDLNGFDRHRERDHNIWNYLYFMYYLQNKESTELSGVESYVKELIIKEDSSWVPLLRTAKIDEKESSEKCEENIDILLETIAQLNKELDTNPDIVRSFAPLK
jgi:hypothetical protein